MPRTAGQIKALRAKKHKKSLYDLYMESERKKFALRSKVAQRHKDYAQILKDQAVRRAKLYRSK